MDKLASHPTLLQYNCRTLLTALADALGRPATLDDLPDSFFDHLRNEYQLDIFYLLGVWTTGNEGFEKAVGVMKDSKLPRSALCSSPFAVVEYTVHKDFGGNEALQRFRKKLKERHIRLILDFVPNHVAMDHPWLSDPSLTKKFIMPGSDWQVQKEPHNYSRRGNCIIAHGKDPNFDGWTDTAQLNYFSADLQAAQVEILKKIALQADGVRCDMAMLVLSSQMERTWGERYKDATGNRPPKCPDFWRIAIEKIRSVNKDFIFMAEVYWNLEAELMSEGFDYCYDKGLYDSLKHGNVEGVKWALNEVTTPHQGSLVRFLENHDEERAHAMMPNKDQHLAAAALAYFSPGLKFFHWGQFDGWTYKMPMQQKALPEEPSVGVVRDMYIRLLTVLRRDSVKNGKYFYIEVKPSAESSEDYKSLCAFVWVPPEGGASPPLLVVSNYSGTLDSTGFISLANSKGGAESYVKQRMRCCREINVTKKKEERESSSVFLRDVYAGSEAYVRSMAEFSGKGIWFRLSTWQTHVFELFYI